MKNKSEKEIGLILGGWTAKSKQKKTGKFKADKIKGESMKFF